MSETRYMISDAAKKIDVETHVLRYWEEELEIEISRTELGHRYYTEEDIRLFQNIKELKERGIQLKAIKILIPELKKRGAKSFEEGEIPVDNIIHLDEKRNERALQNVPVQESEALPAIGPDPDKLVQFESIVTNIFKQVILDNNAELEGRITDSMVKEMNLLMQIREEREEERFRRLDDTIRAHQKNRQMVAATREPGMGRKKKWFGFL